MDKIVVVFTMKSCPFCHTLKENLDKEGIDRDIHEHEEEYNMFVDITGNDYVPAFMLIENPDSEQPLTELFAPERDFDTIDDGAQIIREFFER
jgi:glutaredoxin